MQGFELNLKTKKCRMKENDKKREEKIQRLKFLNFFKLKKKSKKKESKTLDSV